MGRDLMGRAKEAEMNTAVSKFRKWNHIETFNVGKKVRRNDNCGVITMVIFRRCYMVRWEDGRESHVYHHEVG